MKKLFVSLVLACVTCAGVAQVVIPAGTSLNITNVAVAPSGGTPAFGPGSSTNNAWALWDGTAGNLLKNSNVTYSSPTLSVPAGFGITGAGSLAFTAGGSNQSITLTPIGTGTIAIGSGTSSSKMLLNFPGTAGSTAGIGTRDGSNLALFDSSGEVFLLQPSTNVFRFTGNYSLGWSGGLTSATATDIGLIRTSSGVLRVNLAEGGSTTSGMLVMGTARFGNLASGPTITATGASPNENLVLTPGGTGGVTVTSAITSYKGVATAGWGVGAIQAAAEVTAQSAANASIATYTVGAADGTFEVSAQANVTAATAISTTLTCTYTDKSNTSRVMIFPVQQLTGSFIAGGLITGTGAWETPVMHIRCKASTAITIGTSAGTFTGVTYSADATIVQTN